MSFWFPYCATICLVWTAVTTLSVFPHQLAYFNEAAGGPADGYKHLISSNFDWGQDLTELERSLESHPEWGPVACVSSEGAFEYQCGMRAIPLRSLEGISSLAGYSHVAVDANVLAGDETSYGDAPHHSPEHAKIIEALRSQPPAGFSGYSIRVFAVDPLVRRIHHDNTVRDSGEHDAAPPIDIESVFSSVPTLADVSTADDLSISMLLHILLLHEFRDTGLNKPASGQEALRLLTDEPFAKAVVGQTPFVRTRNGLRYKLDGAVLSERAGIGESHRDQCLAVFAALQLPLDHPLALDTERYTLADLLSESVANFSFEQGEVAWTAAAYAHYIPPLKQWTDRFGKTTTFSQLLEHLIDRGYRGQSCGGMHVLQVIASIIEADYRSGILDRKGRVQGRRFLQESIDRAVASQQHDGSWNGDWYEAQPVPGSNAGSLELKLVVTGHMLELMFQLRKRPPAPTIVAATRWLYNTLRELKRANKRSDTLTACPLTHALRAIQMACRNRSLSTYELAKVFAAQ